MLSTSAFAIGRWSAGRSFVGLDGKNNNTSSNPSAPSATMIPSGLVVRAGGWFAISVSQNLHLGNRPIVRVVVRVQPQSKVSRLRRLYAVSHRHFARCRERAGERQ